MRALTASAGVLFVAAAQVTVAPLFPVAGTVAELPLVAASVFAWLHGVRSLLLALPALAVLTALLAGRDPGLILIAFAGAFPALAVALELRWPLGRWVGALVGLAASGLWCRAILIAAAAFDGARGDPTALVGRVLAPGAAADAAFFLGAVTLVASARWVRGHAVATGEEGALRWR